MEMFSLWGKSPDAANPWLVRWLCARKSPGTHILSWTVTLDLMVQDVSWSSSHHSYLQAARTKKEQRAEVEASISSPFGNIAGSCSTELPFPTYRSELGPRTNLAGRKAEKQHLLWAAMGNSYYSYGTVENTQWVRWTSSLCPSVRLISDYCWESIWWIKTRSLLYSLHSEYHLKCKGNFSLSVPSPVPRSKEALMMVSFTDSFNHRILLKSL